MRYIKKLALNKKDPQNDRFSVLADDRIVTQSKASIQVPTGSKSNRPITLIDGTVRFNTDLKEFEVYNSFNTGSTPWEIIRTIRPATITPQELGYGNYNDYLFGPLAYPVSITKPQNILVFVDNVYQQPTSSYTLVNNPSSATTALSTATISNTTTVYLNTLTNIDTGKPGQWRVISAASGITAGTTITNVSFTYDAIHKGYPIGLSLPTTTNISSGTVVSVIFNTGTYVQFTGPVPARPVFVLLGFDGYFPAGPAGDAFES